MHYPPAEPGKSTVSREPNWLLLTKRVRRTMLNCVVKRRKIMQKVRLCTLGAIVGVCGSILLAHPQVASATPIKGLKCGFPKAVPNGDVTCTPTYVSHFVSNGNPVSSCETGQPTDECSRSGQGPAVHVGDMSVITVTDPPERTDPDDPFAETGRITCPEEGEEYDENGDYQANITGTFLIITVEIYTRGCDLTV